MDDSSLDACMKKCTFMVEYLHENVYELLGRAIIRKDKDPTFDPLMIDAYKKYIDDHQLGWDAKYIGGKK